MAKKKSIVIGPVRIKKGACDANGKEFYPWVYNQVHPVVSVDGNRVAIGNGAMQVIAVVDIKDVIEEKEEI